ncbi:LysR family transcriptional regulator [Variovorax sp. OV329]|uniref:LysR family transcriptional regulator n=1 Tax=Variovorax sp. OV329 TaxID=1882825 RepID=UPI0008E378F3|nr:LysR family transcriptional regulator [Variovorax sp. OV329]SFM68648.1 transcriptional regulator, LysR family [Variovorax sp. OV329]
MPQPDSHMLDRAQGLIAFVRAVESGSFSAAARVLGTSPSAVSKNVAKLEARFGVRLFRRSTRSLTLTREGAAYFERVAPLLRALDEAGDVIRPEATALGVLRITAPGDLGRILMDAVTRLFLPAHRGLKLEVSLTDRHVNLIREGFDIAVRAGEAVDSDLNARLLARLPMVLAASPAYLAARGTPGSRSDLEAHDHIRYVLDGRPFPLRFADGSVYTPPGVLDADSGVATRIAALNGLGIVQMMRLAVQDDIDAGRLVPLLPAVALPLVPVHALHPFGRHPPLRVRLCIDFLVDQLAFLAAAR